MSHVQQLREAIRMEDGPSSQCKRSLLRVIDHQIIPQLSGVHEERAGSSPSQPTRPLVLADGVLARFAALCCADDEQLCMAFITDLLQDGHALSDVLQNLVAPAARHLGQQWDQDRIDFSAVALGLARMQAIAHHFVPLERQTGRMAEDKFSIMLAAAPGTTHLLGLTMIQELFASDGWDVRLELATSPADLQTAVAADWMDVLGLSVGLTEQLDRLPALVADLRQRSLNPRMGVLLGGAAFQEAASAPHAYGADAICLDPGSAIRTARRMAMQVHAGGRDPQPVSHPSATAAPDADAAGSTGSGRQRAG